MRGSAPASRQVQRSDEPEPQERRLAWEDPGRPAGSAFSQQEWAAAAAGGFLVMEVHKAAERGLVQMDPTQLDVVHRLFLDRALLIDEKLGDQHPAWFNASARLHHYTHELGRWNYRVVHPQEVLERHPYLASAKLREGPPELLEQEDQAPRPRP